MTEGSRSSLQSVWETMYSNVVAHLHISFLGLYFGLCLYHLVEGFSKEKEIAVDTK